MITPLLHIPIENTRFYEIFGVMLSPTPLTHHGAHEGEAYCWAYNPTAPAVVEKYMLPASDSGVYLGYVHTEWMIDPSELWEAIYLGQNKGPEMYW